MKRGLLFVIVGVVVALLVLSLGKDMIIKLSVEKGVEIVTGLKLRTGAFRVGLINTVVDIRNLRLFNPPSFRDRVMIDMPEVYIDYDLASAMSNKIHMEEVRLNLKQFVVVKNERGELNLNSLNVVQAQREGKAPAAEAKGKAPQIRIDLLRLKIGRAVYKDYSQGGEPVVKEFNVDIDETYRDIDNPYSLVSLIVVRTMAKTTIANLANFDLKGLQGTVSDTLGTAQKAATEVLKTAEDTGKVAKETVNALKDVFKNPFGSQ